MGKLNNRGAKIFCMQWKLIRRVMEAEMYVM